jgi:hypothetical protein
MEFGILLGFAGVLLHTGLDGTVWRVCTKKVGGLRFVKIGRLCVSFCITKEYKPL